MYKKFEFDEDFLQFIWQNGHFDISKLKFYNANNVVIKNRGFHNTNQGADFLNANIEIDGVDFYGSIEVHKLSSDWNLHGHQNDENYDNVILHVVYHYDNEAITKNGYAIPTLILENAIDKNLIIQYQNFLKGKGFINCENHLDRVENIYKSWALDKAFISRIERKSAEVLSKYKLDSIDWMNVFHNEIFIGFGQNLNGNQFQTLASIVDYKIVQKLENVFQIESLLFGVAGFLEDEIEINYHKELKKEYLYLKNKFQIKEQMKKKVWSFLRMRPYSFPTLRIAQLSSFLATNHHFLNNIIASQDTFRIHNFEVSDFWKKHFSFSEPHSFQHNISANTIELIINNIIIKSLGAYSIYRNDDELKEKLIQLINVTKAENNKIIKELKSLKFPIDTFADSQGALELYTQYCQKQKCLQCVIGNKILKN